MPYLTPRMSWLKTLVGGGLFGGVAGIGSAYVTARWKVRGELEKMRLERGYVIEDRTEEEKSATGERRGALREAATNLINALRDPDDYNVFAAREEVARAVGAIEERGEVLDLAQQLLMASVQGDVDGAEAVLHRLPTPGD